MASCMISTGCYGCGIRMTCQTKTFVAHHLLMPVEMKRKCSVSVSCTRRMILILLSAPAIGLASAANEEQLTTFVDPNSYFTLTLPQGWIQEQASVRNVTAFRPPADTSTTLSVFTSSIGPDFTRMGSFGSAESFAQNVVNSMGTEARLIDARSKQGMYYLEYTIEKVKDKRHHFISLVGIGKDRQLYSVTGDYLEEDELKYRSEISKVVNSFKLI